MSWPGKSSPFAEGVSMKDKGMSQSGSSSKWCRHILWHEGYQQYIFMDYCTIESFEKTHKVEWNLCPNCGAKRPSKKLTQQP